MGARFQELFHSPPGVLFTFPSRYWYAIGQTGMLRLTQRSGLIHAGFHEARATWDNTIGRRLTSRYGAGTLYGQAFKPVPLASRFMTPARPVGTGTRDPTTPATQPPTGITRNRFGLIRFRSPLLTEYPFLQVLRCFSSLTSLPLGYGFTKWLAGITLLVALLKSGAVIPGLISFIFTNFSIAMGLPKRVLTFHYRDWETDRKSVV